MSQSVQSPYYNGIVIKYPDGTGSLERLIYNYTPTGKEKVHTILEGETLQSIAFKYLNDSGLWYQIADANNIIDPFTEVVMGKQIIIPNS